MNNILDIGSNPIFDSSIVDFEWHSHNPYSSNSFKSSDEIRIPVHQQDVYTLPSKSYLLIEGKILKGQGGTVSDDTTTQLISNAMGFLFDEIRYELCGNEIDRVKNVGISTTMKNLLTSKTTDNNWMQNAGWEISTMSVLKDKTTFSFCVPLKLLLGFAEDYKHILLNVKQELVLLRASNDNNVVLQPMAAIGTFQINLTKVVWKMPYVRVDDEVKLTLLRLTERDQPIAIPFRRWQLHEYPSLPLTKFLTWTVKTSSMLEKPRYVIIGFQTDRKDKAIKNSSHFDFCNLENIKLYLNSNYYPYDNLNGNTSILYDMYSRFQSAYYIGSDDQPCVDRETFQEKTPLIVIDCSKQVETLKTGALDVRIEIQTSADIPKDTTAYCLIIHDALVQYTPLSGIVKKIM